jgi:hypothetical protein
MEFELYTFRLPTGELSPIKLTRVHVAQFYPGAVALEDTREVTQWPTALEVYGPEGLARLLAKPTPRFSKRTGRELAPRKRRGEVRAP